jgi:hypothetical protein
MARTRPHLRELNQRAFYARTSDSNLELAIIHSLEVPLSATIHYLKVIFGVYELQSICTVAFDHSRTKMPESLAVSVAKPRGSP